MTNKEQALILANCQKIQSEQLLEKYLNKCEEDFNPQIYEKEKKDKKDNH